MSSRIQLIVILMLSVLSFSFRVYGYGDFERARKAVVKIIVDNGNKIGTGSIVKMEDDKAIILTAWHVVSNGGMISGDIEVCFFGMNSVPFKAEVLIETINVKDDIVCLIVENVPRDLATVSIASARKFEGREEVFVIGHLTNGPGWNFITTRVINKLGTSFVLMSHCVIDSGSSGAPVFNKRAEMIAMIQEISRTDKTDPKAETKIEFSLALEADPIISSIREFKLGPLPQVGMPLRRKAGWALSGTGVVSTFGASFAYYYYRQAQHNWEKAKTTAESDKYGDQRKVRGGITASLTAIALTDKSTGRQCDPGYSLLLKTSSKSLKGHI